ncbi:hypothetical protein [Ruegeria atlantica]|uniref:Uncharacterized protein n=1 Tax=Ruegeria atlantica TaxID=81569 RepID=A0A0N7LPR5_9RHOB|nr:hypothetical protein [Ruegeria atlantica]CUH45956.1 hypothetical protein RUA4292_00119 [Ruegeria atlantica]
MARPTAHRFKRKPFAWTVEVEGIGTVPVFHSRYYGKDRHYHHIAKDAARFGTQMDALEATGCMILQLDESDDDLKCLGYVGGASSTAARATVFTVGNVMIDRDALAVSFDVVDLVG